VLRAAFNTALPATEERMPDSVVMKAEAERLATGKHIERQAPGGGGA